MKLLAFAVLALIVLARAECFRRQAVFDGGDATGVSTASVSGLDDGSTQTTVDTTRCQGAVTPATGSCCSPALLDKLVAIANAIKQKLDSISTEFTTDIQGINLIDTSKFPAQTPADLVNAVNTLNTAITTFKSSASADINTCFTGVEHYVAGAVCSICRPDFFPNVVDVHNSSFGLVRSWKWHPGACDDLVTACKPLYNDVDQLLFALIDFLAQPSVQQVLHALNITLPSASNRDSIRPCRLLAQLVNDPDPDPCRPAICRVVFQGLRLPQFWERNFVSDLFELKLNANKKSQDSEPLLRSVSAVSHVLGSFSSYAVAAKRQSTAGTTVSNTDANSFTGTYQVTQAGQGSTVGSVNTASSSSSAAAVISVVVMFIAALLLVV